MFGQLNFDLKARVASLFVVVIVDGQVDFLTQNYSHSIAIIQFIYPRFWPPA